MSSPRKPFEPEVLVNGRHASSRTFLIAALFGAAIAIAAGCGGGGGSSTAPSGGSGPVATASPSPGASPVTQSLSVGQALAPSATFSPLPLTGVGSTTITIGLTSASASATVIATAQGAQPSGVAVPSAMARRPASIGGSIVSLAFISVATTSGSTTLQKSPSFSASFTNALSGSNIYLAQYTNGTWSTIAIGALSSGNKVATFLPFTEPITYGTAATWFVIFTDSLSLPSPTPAPNPTGVPTGAPTTAPTIGPTAAPLPDALQFNVPGLYGEIIANGLPAPRQLVALPNGDLLVGTDDKSGTVWIVPHADGPAGAGTPKIFTTVPSPSTQEPAQGLAFDGSNVYIATNQSVWQVPYKTGDQSEPTPTVEIAKVRRGPIAPMSDGDVHFTSSVAVVSATTPKMLYVGVGSSCNACVEVDPTRGTIQSVNLGAGQLSQTLAASRFRNALALAVNPATNTLWAGGAGQDDLLQLDGSVVIGDNSPYDGHPFEFFDPVTTHSGIPDYGWPVCEENNHLYNPLNAPGATCKAVAPATVGSGINDVQPAVELFAYSTIIGAAFYPANQTGANAFPASVLPGGLGGVFLSMHGSWHESAANMEPIAVPEVVYVPITSGTDRPQTAVNISNPGAQWDTILYGFQDPISGTRIGRPVGLAVGVTGSLFIADDFAGVIYRIRPGSGPSAKLRRSRLK